MSDQSPYAVLARAYDDAGFSTYAETLTPALLEMLQKDGWMGKRILDLGCGTGVSTAFLASVGMDVTGFDNSPHMLEVARMRAEGTNYLMELSEGDIRTMTYPIGAELVYCIGNVLNELNSYREVEMVFQKVHQALEPNKLWVFDMLTLRGLGEYLGTKEQVLEASDRMLLIFRTSFSYETLSLRQSIISFSQSGMSETWERASAHLTLRGYPHANIAALLNKTGFKLLGTYNSQLQAFDPQNDTDGRMIFVAEKQG